MGLFDFISEAVATPFRVAGQVAKTTVKTTGKLVTGDLEGAAKETFEDNPEELERIAKKLSDALDE